MTEDQITDRSMHLQKPKSLQTDARLQKCFWPIVTTEEWNMRQTTGAEHLFEVFSQRYERGSTIVTSNLPFDEWTQTFGSERLTGALLDRLTHNVHILEMNGESCRLKHNRKHKMIKSE